MKTSDGKGGGRGEGGRGNTTKFNLNLMWALFVLSLALLPSFQSNFEFTSDPRGNWEKRTWSGGVGGGT